MKKLNKLIALLLLLSIFATALFSCEDPTDDVTPDDNQNQNDQGNNDQGNTGNDLPPFVDYVANVKLDLTSDRVRTEATVKSETRRGETVYTGFVDGDTTHFEVPTSVSRNGILKARYIAINTPESTGQIEPWGKKASNFTKEKLSNATSIILESNTSRWDLDSTGDRYLVWVWYKTADMTDYRNLNLEIMQEGLAFASSYTDFVYADACRDIVTQARTHKLHVHDKTLKDPDFYYGAATPITLKELKTNIDEYVNKSVCFEGVVVKNVNQTAYVEEYDEETGVYFGMQVYYGWNLGYFGEQILQVGNRVLIAGSVQYYAAGGTYQISDVYYYPTIPNHEDNIQLVSSGHSATYQTVDANTFMNNKVEVSVITTDEAGNETTTMKTFDYGYLTMHSTKKLENLTITDTYTTSNGGNNDGAISITCRAEDGTVVTLRTTVMRNADGSLVTQEAFPVGTKISYAQGIVDAYDGDYQLKVFTPSDIVFAD